MSFLKITFAVVLTILFSFWVSAKFSGRNKAYDRTFKIMKGKIEVQNDKIKDLEMQIEDLRIQIKESNK